MAVQQHVQHILLTASCGAGTSNGVGRSNRCLKETTHDGVMDGVLSLITRFI